MTRFNTKLSFIEVANNYDIPSIPYTPELIARLQPCTRDGNDRLVAALGMKPTRNIGTGDTLRVVITYPQTDVLLCIEPDNAWSTLYLADKQGKPLRLSTLGTDSVEGCTDCLASQVVAKLEAVARLPRNRTRDTTQRSH